MPHTLHIKSLCLSEKLLLLRRNAQARFQTGILGARAARPHLPEGQTQQYQAQAMFEVHTFDASVVLACGRAARAPSVLGKADIMAF